MIHSDMHTFTNIYYIKVKSPVKATERHKQLHTVYILHFTVISNLVVLFFPGFHHFFTHDSYYFNCN